MLASVPQVPAMLEEIMEYFGMFALGGFVGGFLIQGMKMATDISGFQRMVYLVFGAAFTGVYDVS